MHSSPLSGSSLGPEDQDPPRRGYEGFPGDVTERRSTSVPAWPGQHPGSGSQPNIVLILIDDMGYSDLGPFGSEIPTPNIDALAENGVRLTNFHAAPVCAPSRAALLTGMNPHRAGFGTVSHAAQGYPGFRFALPEGVPTLADKLRKTGYATYMVGKWHLTHDNEMHDGADRSDWPTQKGFDRYFGSLDGFTSQFQPHRLVRDNSAITETLPDDSYLTDLTTDEAIGMVRTLRANDPVKPFFLYFAHTAVHAPIQAKPEDLERTAGMYEDGWDAAREARFARQKELGLFPGDTECAPAVETPWDELSDEEKVLYRRHMEAYAAEVVALDDSVGRLVAQLRAQGELERTIFVVTSDNGGTDSGGAGGTRSYFSQFIHRPDLPKDWDRDVEAPLEHIGGPRAYSLYPAGWAQCSNTPLKNYKGTPYDGGIRSPLIISWPAGLPRRDGDTGIRHQYAFMTDLHPTLLDLAGVQLESWQGHPLPEIDGVSLRPLLADPETPPLRNEQYYEHMGRRALYSGGWKLVTDHRRGMSFDEPGWELYETAKDPAETRNLASERPELVAELAERWRRAAWWNTVFPLDDTHAALRPAWQERYSQPVTLTPEVPTLERFRSARLMVLRDVEIRASFDWRRGDRGVLIAHGDQGGGYSVAVDEDGTVTLAYNAYGRMHRTSTALPTEGAQTVTLSSTTAPDFGTRLVLSAGSASAELGPVPALLGMAPFTGISVGRDAGSPVDWDRHAAHGHDPYTGAGLTVRIEPGPRSPIDRERLVEIDELTGRLAD